MPSTYTPIATTTLGSDAYSVTFSSISSTYTDLKLVINCTTSATIGGFLQFNGDTGSNYSVTGLYGDGSSAGSFRSSSQTSTQINNMSTSRCMTIAQIMNYSNSTTYKTVLSRSDNTPITASAFVGLWRNTAAITSITFVTNSGVYPINAGSTFTLYGVKSA